MAGLQFLKAVIFPGTRTHAQLHLKAERAAVSMAAWQPLRRLLQQPREASQQSYIGRGCMHLGGVLVPVGLLLLGAILHVCNRHVGTDVTHTSVAVGGCVVVSHWAEQQ